MLAIFPELVTAAESRDIEHLAALTLKYFASGIKARRRIEISQVLERFGTRPIFRDIGCLGTVVVRDLKGKPEVHFLVHPSYQNDKQRLNFLLAHMLGHFLLHVQPKLADGEWRRGGYREIVCPLARYGDQSETEGSAEYYCDHFAACLLMPRPAIELGARSGMSSEKLATLFGVTPRVVAHRLTTLGLSLVQSLSSVTEENTTSSVSKNSMSESIENDSTDKSSRSQEALQSSGKTTKSSALISQKGMARIRQLAKLVDDTVSSS